MHLCISTRGYVRPCVGLSVGLSFCLSVGLFVGLTVVKIAKSVENNYHFLAESIPSH